MALDEGGRAGVGHGLDDVGVQGPLAQEGKVAELAGLVLEHPDEEVADALALLLRVLHPFQDVKEPPGCVHVAEPRAETLSHDSGHGFGLTLAQEPVVDEDAHQPVTDGAVHQGGRDRRVDAAAQAAQHAAIAHLLADLLDRDRGEVLHVPVGGAAADAEQEVLQDGPAVLRVHHLGMKLEAVETPPAVGEGGNGGIGGVGDDRPAVGQGGHPVAVAHPHVVAVAGRDAGKQVGAVVDLEVGKSILAFRGFRHAAPHGLVDDAHAVADSEEGHGQPEQLGLDRGGVAAVDARGSAGQDDAGGLEPRQPFHRSVERVDLAVDAGFTHAARDQLGVLRPEIQNDDHSLR